MDPAVVQQQVTNSGLQLMYIFLVVTVVLVSLAGISFIKNMESKIKYSLNYFKPIVQGDPMNLYKKVMGFALIVLIGIILKYRNKSVAVPYTQ
jgi:hypothetical protein